MNLGKRVRQLREKNGLTLEELASRTELTKGFLSQLERNLASPSISTLEDIVEVLGVSLADFFREEEHRQVVYTEQDYSTNERDLDSITYLVPNGQKNLMEPVLVKLKSEGCSDVIAPHEGEEIGYIIQGRVVLRNLESQESRSLKKGETFYIRGDFRHCLENRGKTEAVILWISTPPVF